MIIKVLLPILHIEPLYYLGIDNLGLGDIVIVPFRNKELIGIVWELDATPNKEMKLKQVISKVPLEYSVTTNVLKFIQKSAEYYISDLGTVAKMVLPVNIAQNPIKEEFHKIPDYTLPTLEQEQKEALKVIQDSKKPILLQGINGSGKTEVYFHAISQVLKEGKQVLLMLPEIALTNQIIDRFVIRFGFIPGQWHSAVTNASKKKILRGILSQKIKIVIGARSALFLPYPNLGLIIVDEEHDQSYKQESGIRYNARDMAVLLGNILSTKVILISGSPSIETYHNTKEGKYNIAFLHQRYQSKLPNIKVIDIKNSPSESIISKDLINAIHKTIDQGNQALLFLNRKGYAPIIMCKLCGHRNMCPHCSIGLVLYKSKKCLLCHHCGYIAEIPSSCPSCKQDSIINYGLGIERVAEEISEKFPQSRVLQISKETMDNPKNINEILYKIQNHEVDIIIATQILAKGYHFPKLNFVGVLDIDVGLSRIDLRSLEKTFQLISQVAGRAGREGDTGEVYIQTYYPQNHIVDLIKNYNLEEFLQQELDNRKNMQFPPFSRMISIIIESKYEEAAQKTSDIIKSIIGNRIQVLGPIPAILFKLKKQYRFRITLVANRLINMQKIIDDSLSLIKIPSYVNIKIDVDPYSFMI